MLRLEFAVLHMMHTQAHGHMRFATSEKDSWTTDQKCPSRYWLNKCTTEWNATPHGIKEIWMAGLLWS